MSKLLKDEGPQRMIPPREGLGYCAGCGFAVFSESEVKADASGIFLHTNCEAPPVKPVPKCAWCGGIPVGLFASVIEEAPVHLCKFCGELDDAVTTDEFSAMRDAFLRSRQEAERLREALRLILASEVSCELACARERAETGEWNHDQLCRYSIAQEALG